MKYYIRKIEETATVTEEETTYNEYASVSKEDDYNTALSKYYTALSNVAASTAHVYFNIELLNSTGNVIKDEVIGSYIDPDAVEPEPTPEEV